MILQTNLKHVATADEHSKVINNNENVMVCCGRMGPMCTPVYSAMKELENEYPDIEFRDMLPKSKVGKLLRREIRSEEERKAEK